MKVLVGLLIILTFSSIAQAMLKPSVGLNIERIGDMTHLEFRGQKTWTYDLKKKEKVLEVIVPRVKEADLEKYKKHNDLLISKIEVKEDAPNKSKILIHLNDKGVESFDYLTQEPNHLIVDLFVSDQSLLDKMKKESVAGFLPKKKLGGKKVAKTKSTGKVKKQARKQSRDIAFAEYLFADEDGEKKAEDTGSGHSNLLNVGKISQYVDDFFEFSNFSSGEDSILEAKVIEAKGNIYLRFPVLTLENKHLGELEQFAPEYEIKKSFSDENKQARFLLYLMEKGSYAAFIKAKRIFRKTFPVSKYDEILDYAEADVWIQLWKKDKRKEFFDKGINLYKKMVERNPYSKVTERTLVYAGLLAHREGRYFLSTKLLKRYLDNYGETPFSSYAKIYLADGLARMHNYDGAVDLYEDVIASGEVEPSIDATYRLGDVYFIKQDYRRAERMYKRALKKYPDYSVDYPNVWFNMAEAQFVMAEYPDSLRNYRKFFDLYSRHDYSGYALTRIGELIDILGGGKRVAQGFYNESYFRYRHTTGGVIARVRSLSQRFKGMRMPELKETIREIRQREREIDIAQIDEFIAFMISDGFYSRGDFLQAADTLIRYFQRNPAPVNIRKFEKRVSRSIAGAVKEQIENDNVVRSLGIIEKHQKSWLSKSRRVDVQFFKNIAYEKLGLLKQSIKGYKRLVKRLNHLDGSREERERRIFEYYPSFDSVNLRIATAALADNQPKLAADHLKEIKKAKDFLPYERLDYFTTLSKLAYQKKKYPDALALIEKVTNIKINNKEKRDKFKVYLSEVYERNSQFKKAIGLLEDYIKESNKKGEGDQVYVLSRLFHLYKNSGLDEKAIETGDRLLADYEKKYNLEKERYYLGELHYMNKRPKEARQVWKELDKKGMWARLANNKMDSIDWKKQTENSLKRIPAMQR